MISHPLLKGVVIELAFIGTEFEGGVQRAEGDDGSEQEDTAQDEQHDAEGAGDDAAEVQVSENRGEDDPDDAVEVGHVAFHFKISWMDQIGLLQSL